jgi:drug/metabolite transporter (DMT)-like permease
MDKEKRNGHIAVFAANILFGLNTPVSRSIMPDIIDPYLLSFLRLSGGMVLFWLASVFVREKVSKKDVFLLFFAAILALTTNQLPFIIGLSMTSPIDASIVVTMLPILSMLFAALFIKEPITFKKTLGVLTGASGALLLVFSQADKSSSGNMWGNLIIFGAVMSFALYLTLFKKTDCTIQTGYHNEVDVFVCNHSKFSVLFQIIRHCKFCRLRHLYYTENSVRSNCGHLYYLYIISNRSKSTAPHYTQHV